MAFWRTKTAISLKRVKIEEKLLRTAYRNSPTLFRMVPTPTPYGIHFLNIGGLQHSYTLLSQEYVKLRTSNFVGYIYRANPNKSPLKILEKRERGHIQGMTKFFGYPNISGTGKAMNFKFCRYIHRVDRNKSP